MTTFLYLLLIISISCTHFFKQPCLFVYGDTDLIDKTCKTTKYYDLCLSSLKSDSTSSEADTKGLARIMITIGLANATSTNSFLSTRLSSPRFANNKDAAIKRVLKECAQKYLYAEEALKTSLENMEDELYDYAYMNVMAAGDYPGVCHNAFKRNLKLVYPKELAAREESFKHICDVIMEIIDTLG